MAEGERGATLSIEDELSKLRSLNNTLSAQNNELKSKLAALQNEANPDEFFNDLSHEIRTPVQGIAAISKGLVNNWTNFDPSTNYELATKIAQNSQRLFSLIDNILEFSRLKKGVMELRFKKVSLIPLIQEMVQECLDIHLNKKDIALEIEANVDQNTTLLIDESKIIQVLRNILINALKVMPSGNITISLSKMGTSTVIAIRAKGPRIGKTELYGDLTNIDEETHNLSSIGFIVSQKIIKAHGGKIKIENPDVNTIKYSFSLNTTSAAAAKQKKIATIPSTNANVVIIDDEEACLLGMSMMLHKTNYKLHSFAKPTEAISALKNNPELADIILLDIMMPEINGVELLRQLNLDAKLKRVPVIMQSGVADIKQINEALALGAKDFLRKPYTKETLIEAIENVLKEKG